MNSINLAGNICNDLELKTTQTGKSVTQFNLAVKRPHTSDVTDFIPVVVWNQSAEYLCRYANKGSKVAVSGKLTTRKYQDKDGNNRTAFEVIADDVEILNNRQGGEQAQTENHQPTYNAPVTPDFKPVNLDDDLPF